MNDNQRQWIEYAEAKFNASKAYTAAAGGGKAALKNVKADK